MMAQTASANRRALIDQHGRVKRKLRLSLTDRCNFRCRYCMPEKPKWLPEHQRLTIEEMSRLVRLFVCELGVTQLRLTGGEPLLRHDIGRCVETFAALKNDGLERISLTTNGALLARHVQMLAGTGIDDINVSLDARTPDVFRALTGADIKPVLDGINAARAAGIPIKINTVVIRGYNDGEVFALARWAYDEAIPLRFIEFMPLDGRGFWSEDKVVSEREIRQALSSQFDIRELTRTSDPATPILLNERYTLGVISTVSAPFCHSCDRVRVTATGELYSCLFADRGADLRTPLRDSTSDKEIVERIRDTIWRKGRGYAEHRGYVTRPITMHQLGG
jgi:GTP 3',8-cyclase